MAFVEKEPLCPTRDPGSVARCRGPQQPARFPGRRSVCRPAAAPRLCWLKCSLSGDATSRVTRARLPCPHVAVSQTLVRTHFSRCPGCTPRAGGSGGQCVHSRRHPGLDPQNDGEKVGGGGREENALNAGLPRVSPTASHPRGWPSPTQCSRRGQWPRPPRGQSGGAGQRTPLPGSSERRGEGPCVLSQQRQVHVCRGARPPADRHPDTALEPESQRLLDRLLPFELGPV